MADEPKMRIPGHEEYRITEDGRVFGKYGKELIGHIDRCGYHEVLLQEHGIGKWYLVHRLVAITFIPNPNDLPFINHKDGNKLNNSVDNLEWCTRSQNAKHSFENRLQSRVTNRHGSFDVLTQEQKKTIYELFNKGFIDKEIAKVIGCSRELVGRKIREAGLR